MMMSINPEISKINKNEEDYVHDNKTPIITIIVPVYNEEENVEHLLNKLAIAIKVNLLQKKNWLTEVIIVDDGSTDRSCKLIHAIIRNEPFFRLFKHKQNQGKGAAISTALKKARGTFCIIQDADLEYNPFEIHKLLGPLFRGEVQVAFGSRYMNLHKYDGLWSHFLGNKILSIAGSILIRRKITDIMTCYKAFRRDLIKGLQSRSFDVEPELTAKLLLNKEIRFIEIPISYSPRLQGKKIKKIDGILSLKRLITTIIRIQHS